jgi:hypothetical protein
MSRNLRLSSELELQRMQSRIREGSAAVAVAAKRSKYGNVKTDGYASAREAKRAEALKLMQRAGQIRNLREQVEHVLIPTQYDDDGKLLEHAWCYRSDFEYDLAHNDEHVVEDAKGVRTAEYIAKRKAMLFFTESESWKCDRDR